MSLSGQVSFEAENQWICVKKSLLQNMRLNIDFEIE